VAQMPLHPRLGHMLAQSDGAAADIAALLAERDPLPRTAPVDLTLRLRAVSDGRSFAARHPWDAHAGTLARIRAEAKRLKRFAGRTPRSAAEAAALAYPDRIALRRPGDAPRYLLSGGKGAVLPDGDPLCSARLLVATDLDGDAREARIRQAIQISESELRGLYGAQITWEDTCTWDKRARKVRARRQERFGALVLDDRIWTDVPDDTVAAALIEGVHDLGINALGWSAGAARFRARVALFPGELPDMSDAALLATCAEWLPPYLTGIRDAEALKRLDPLAALRAMLSWDDMQRLDALAPPAFETPLGRRIPIDYGGPAPEIAVRLQEMFGVTTHPTVGPQREALRVTLLSPAGRPVQTTTDLPGFWDSSYSDVRKDMRGRYPKHPWPEDPRQADPTLRPKGRSKRE